MTKQAPYTLYYHQDVLEFDLELRRRAYFILQRLLVHGEARFKGTAGVNAGWRRTPLGGNGGNHYYLWWAPRGARPLKAHHEALEERSVVVRAVRHHDDTDELMSLGDLERDYLIERDLPKGLEEPWGSEQARFIGLRERVVTLLGTPGTGKTTTLWGSIEKGAWTRGLYLTWSERLAENAEATINFVKPSGSEVRVRSTLRFFAELLGGAWLERLERALTDSMLGGGEAKLMSWVSSGRVKHHKDRALIERAPTLFYGLIRAWVLGREPWEGKRALTAISPRELKSEGVGISEEQKAWDAVIESSLKVAQRVYQKLALSAEEEETLAPELVFARAALERVRDTSRPLPSWCEVELIVVDEIQDLTPLEVEVLVALAQRLERERGVNVSVRVAGDEGQVVRPTYFAWRELTQHLYQSLAEVERVRLDENLRCPREVVNVLSRLSERYQLLPPRLRPKAQQLEQLVGVESEGEVGLLELSVSEALGWLEERAEGSEVALIYLDHEPPLWANERPALRDYLMSPAKAKGLEFKLVVLIGLNRALAELTKKEAKADPLAFYLKLNELRVAVSRSTEHLIALEVSEEQKGRALAHELMSVTSADLSCLEQSQDHHSARELSDQQRSERAQRQATLKQTSLGEQTSDERIALLIDKAERERDRSPANAWRALARAEALLNEPEADDDSLRARLTPLRLKLLSPLKARVEREAHAELSALALVMEALAEGVQMSAVSAQRALNALSDLPKPPLWLEAELKATLSPLKEAFYRLERATQDALKASPLVSVWLELDREDEVEHHLSQAHSSLRERSDLLTKLQQSQEREEATLKLFSESWGAQKAMLLKAQWAREESEGRLFKVEAELKKVSALLTTRERELAEASEVLTKREEALKLAQAEISELKRQLAEFKPSLKPLDRVETKLGEVTFFERVIPAPPGGEAFLMMETQVTQALWEVVMGSNPSAFKGPRKPVETVSWEDSVKFANALSRKLGLTPAYSGDDNNARFVEGANGFRLPLEAEWEFAARGGEGFKFAGSDNLDEVGWYGGEVFSGNVKDVSTQDVGQLKPNAYGLYDMSGNVWEWCSDDYDEPGQHRPGAVLRVERGGSWDGYAVSCAVTNRSRFTPDLRCNSLGLRLSRSLA